MLDKGLTWKKKLDRVTNKAYRAFWTCRGSLGRTWGLKPKEMHWIYTVVVRPQLPMWPVSGGLGSNSEQAELNLENCKGWPRWVLLEQ
jgi:hypothetical protein